jgi:SAM-dependent methyltransferase
VADVEPDQFAVPLAHLPAEAKARRSGSFGQVASHYERYRPGPPTAAVEWLMPARVARVVDLGAGTGALTRLLTDKADEVVAIEPDDRMREVLTAELPGVRAEAGRGESMPLPDRCTDAVLASSSWHWMDVDPTLREVARVLVPGGILAALWTGPDPDGPFMAEARRLLAEGSPEGGRRALEGNDELRTAIIGDALRPVSSLEIPPDAPFEQPEHRPFTWDVPLRADDLIGLLGTLSWVITMPEEPRAQVMAEARRLLGELLGVEGEVTVDVAFRCDVWRSRLTG